MTAALTSRTDAIDATDLVSIESIKKAFIRLNERVAANEAVNLPLADDAHVEAIKRAIAPAEFEYKTKVQVVVGAVGGLDQSAPAQVQNGKVKLLANLIKNDKQALDAFYLGVRGLLALPLQLDRLGNHSIQQIFAGLNEEQLTTLTTISDLDATDDPRLVVETYLAYLASLNIKLSFFDRRNSWQRSLLRKLYPKLKWTAEDLQYLILNASKRWVKQQLKARK